MLSARKFCDAAKNAHDSAAAALKQDPSTESVERGLTRLMDLREKANRRGKPVWALLLERHAKSIGKDQCGAKDGYLKSFRMVDALFGWDKDKDDKPCRTVPAVAAEMEASISDQPILFDYLLDLDAAPVPIKCTCESLRLLALFYYGLRCVFAHGDATYTLKIGVLQEVSQEGFEGKLLTDTGADARAEAVERDLSSLLKQIEGSGCVGRVSGGSTDAGNTAARSTFHTVLVCLFFRVCMMCRACGADARLTLTTAPW
jgi:hypothetical protein